MLLTDITVEHTIAPPKGGLSVKVVLHPFTNTQRDSLGKFEIVRTVREPGAKDVKRSTSCRFSSWRSCTPKACSTNTAS